MKAGRRAASSILHVDMDAFFASVEQRDRPELRGRPIAVGGSSRARGVVAAASYEARPFGVRSAMPMARALRLCPSLRVVPGDYGRYRRESERIMAIFRSFTPLVEPLSLDEAFLDLAGTEGLFGPPGAAAHRVKERIRVECGLVASVGAATSKLVAKIASDQEKPDGLVVVPPGGEESFLGPLPVERILGVGPRAAADLHRHGIRTIGDAARTDPDLLDGLFGPRGRELARLARGMDPRPVIPARQPKGHSRERTFTRDLTDPEVMERILLEFADQVAWEVRREGWVGGEVKLKVRTIPFDTRTRSRKLVRPTDLAAPLYRTGLELFRGLGDLPPVRLLGLGLGDLMPAGEPRQQDLFGRGEVEQGRRLARGVDRIRAKYGRRSIGPGRLLEGGDQPGPSPEA